MNSLAVLAAAKLAGADLALAALALAELDAADRPRRAHRRSTARRRGAPDRRKLQRQSGLDARRARVARPGADRAARPAHRRAGRHAGTRRRAAALHRGLAAPVEANAIDLVFCCGPADARAVGGPSRRAPGRLCRDLRGARSAVLAAIRAGDAVMVKGSLGSRMGPIVKALRRQFSQRGPAPTASGARLTIDALLAGRSLRQALGPQRVPLHHVPHRRRDDHRAAVRVPVRAVDHRPAARCGRARASRSAPTGRNRTSSTKKGTPTMGGLMILSGILVSTLLWANPPTPMSGSCSA